MPLHTHIAELSEKHRVLEKKIAEAVASPSVDDAEIRKLKQEKLKLKDQITRLAGDTKH